MKTFTDTWLTSLEEVETIQATCTNCGCQRLDENYQTADGNITDICVQCRKTGFAYTDDGVTLIGPKRATGHCPKCLFVTHRSSNLQQDHYSYCVRCDTSYLKDDLIGAGRAA